MDFARFERNLLSSEVTRKDFIRLMNFGMNQNSFGDGLINLARLLGGVFSSQNEKDEFVSSFKAFQDAKFARIVAEVQANN
jgi:hypothetical protein